jgi:hypothetical protein
MRVLIPKKYLLRIKDFLDYLTAKKISENEENTTFEITSPFRLTMENLGIETRKEWVEFCKNLRVKGGRKSMFGDKVALVPRLSRYVAFKVAGGELRLLKELLKKEGYPSVPAYLRAKVEDDMLQSRRKPKVEEVVGYG